MRIIQKLRVDYSLKYLLDIAGLAHSIFLLDVTLSQIRIKNLKLRLFTLKQNIPIMITDRAMSVYWLEL